MVVRRLGDNLDSSVVFVGFCCLEVWITVVVAAVAVVANAATTVLLVGKG